MSSFSCDAGQPNPRPLPSREGEQSHIGRLPIYQFLVSLWVFADAAAAGLAAVQGVEICFGGGELWVQAERFFPGFLGFV